MKKCKITGKEVPTKSQCSGCKCKKHEIHCEDDVSTIEVALFLIAVFIVLILMHSLL